MSLVYLLKATGPKPSYWFITNPGSFNLSTATSWRLARYVRDSWETRYIPFDEETPNPGALMGNAYWFNTTTLISWKSSGSRNATIIYHPGMSDNFYSSPWITVSRLGQGMEIINTPGNVIGAWIYLYEEEGEEAVEYITIICHLSSEESDSKYECYRYIEVEEDSWQWVHFFPVYLDEDKDEVITTSIFANKKGTEARCVTHSLFYDDVVVQAEVSLAKELIINVATGISSHGFEEIPNTIAFEGIYSTLSNISDDYAPYLPPHDWFRTTRNTITGSGRLLVGVDYDRITDTPVQAFFDLTESENQDIDGDWINNAATQTTNEVRSASINLVIEGGSNPRAIPYETYDLTYLGTINSRQYTFDEDDNPVLIEDSTRNEFGSSTEVLFSSTILHMDLRFSAVVLRHFLRTRDRTWNGSALNEPGFFSEGMTVAVEDTDTTGRIGRISRGTTTDFFESEVESVNNFNRSGFGTQAFHHIADTVTTYTGGWIQIQGRLEAYYFTEDFNWPFCVAFDEKGHVVIDFPDPQHEDQFAYIDNTGLFPRQIFAQNSPAITTVYPIRYGFMP